MACAVYKIFGSGAGLPGYSAVPKRLFPSQLVKYFVTGVLSGAFWQKAGNGFLRKTGRLQQ